MPEIKQGSKLVHFKYGTIYQVLMVVRDATIAQQTRIIYKAVDKLQDPTNQELPWDRPYHEFLERVCARCGYVYQSSQDLHHHCIPYEGHDFAHRPSVFVPRFALVEGTVPRTGEMAAGALVPDMSGIEHMITQKLWCTCINVGKRPCPVHDGKEAKTAEQEWWEEQERQLKINRGDCV